jgi:hypothetical protein
MEKSMGLMSQTTRKEKITNFVIIKKDGLAIKEAYISNQVKIHTCHLTPKELNNIFIIEILKAKKSSMESNKVLINSTKRQVTSKWQYYKTLLKIIILKFFSCFQKLIDSESILRIFIFFRYG